MIFHVKVLVSISQSLGEIESSSAQSLPLICAEMCFLEMMASEIQALYKSDYQARVFANLLIRLQVPSQEYFFKPSMKLHTYYYSYYFAYCFACSSICYFVYCSVCLVKVNCYSSIPKAPYLLHLIPPILDLVAPLN